MVLVDDDGLVSQDAQALQQQWLAIIKDPATSSALKHAPMQDTVGAVAMVDDYVPAAGVSRQDSLICDIQLLLLDSSSGGILLKLPGRIGEVSATNSTHLSLLTSCRQRRLGLVVGQARTLRAASQVRTDMINVRNLADGCRHGRRNYSCILGSSHLRSHPAKRC